MCRAEELIVARIMKGRGGRRRYNGPEEEDVDGRNGKLFVESWGRMRVRGSGIGVSEGEVTVGVLECVVGVGMG